MSQKNYNTILSTFINDFPDIKVVDKQTGKSYMGIEVFKKFVNSELDLSEGFVISEGIGKHDKDGTMMYRGDVVDGKLKGHILRGVIDYDSIEARYKLYFMDGQVSVFGTDKDEFEYLEVVGHVATMITEGKILEQDFLNEKKD